MGSRVVVVAYDPSWVQGERLSFLPMASLGITFTYARLKTTNISVISFFEII